ncbi:MAG: hypothetical protein HQ538_00830, partial [Parcubacteria group bacterium]|nr:hypothetical protein [Parcubacteria group bacterium]
SLTPIKQGSINKLSSPAKLSELTLDDFRSFGVNAEAAISFLINKIKKILSASPENREAVKHYLRQSELYKLYLLQGRESLDLKKDIADIADARKKDGKIFLKPKEFQILKEFFKSL